MKTAVISEIQMSYKTGLISSAKEALRSNYRHYIVSVALKLMPITLFKSIIIHLET